jgi:hypothetical protein
MVGVKGVGDLSVAEGDAGVEGGHDLMRAAHVPLDRRWPSQHLARAYDLGLEADPGRGRGPAIGGLSSTLGGAG